MVTSKDVARQAGVSQTVVSFVLNRTPGQHVSEATRARVLAVIEELGYRPSASARALRRGRSQEICVGVGSGLSPFFIEMMRAMREGAANMGFALTPYIGGGHSPDQPGDSDALTAYVFEHRPAGLVTHPHLFPMARLEVARQRWNLACVYISLEPGAGAPTIQLRVFEAGYLAARHLLQRGHRRLALITPVASRLADPGREAHVSRRRAGMHKAMEDYGDATLRDASMQPTVEDARRVVTTWLRDAHRPTGIYGFSDEYALPLLAALQEQRVRVPDEVAVVGTDDIFFCQLSSPTLTSIQFDNLRIGERAIATIETLLRGDPLPNALASTPSPRLVPRGSS